MSKQHREKMAGELRAAALQWRHCPFGLHTLLTASSNRRKNSSPPQALGVPYIYITMLREPFDRMLSWFAYCNKYSPNKCNAGKDYMVKGQGNSAVTKFYSNRRRLYEEGARAYGASADSTPPSGTFHPNNVEYRLDDNYQVPSHIGRKKCLSSLAN